MSCPPKGGGGGGAAPKGRPKRRAAATHFFKYQLASNPSRAEENDLRRALQESLEEQHQQACSPSHQTGLQQKDATRRSTSRLISSTNSSDVSRSNNSSSSNESNGASRQTTQVLAAPTPTGKALKRNRASQLVDHEQPSRKRSKQANTSNGHSSHHQSSSKSLSDGSYIRAAPHQTTTTTTMPHRNMQLISSSIATPTLSKPTSHGKATQTTNADPNRAIKTYSRSQPQLIKTPQQQHQQFSVTNDLIVVRSSTPKASHPGFPPGTTTAILVSPLPKSSNQQQQPPPPPQSIQNDCTKFTKNTNKSDNNHNHRNSNESGSTNQSTTTGATTKLKKQQTKIFENQQVSQSAKCSSERKELDLHNNESDNRGSKVARCLIFNTMDLSFKAATFEPHHLPGPKLNKGLGDGGTGASKLSQGSWSLLGVPEEKVIYLKDDEPPKRLICYPAIKHVEGDVIQVKDSVLLRSGARKTDLPYIAKVCSFWKNSETGGVMMSLLWYYRPEHTEEGRKPHNLPDEIFASRHRDVDSVECIEDKCYVLTFNEYCRYKKRCKMEQVNTTWSLADVTIPVSNESYPRRTRIPDCDVSSELVFCCRQIYDSRTKRLIKNPLISPKYGNI